MMACYGVGQLDDGDVALVAVKASALGLPKDDDVDNVAVEAGALAVEEGSALTIEEDSVALLKDLFQVKTLAEVW
jgi:hypothetical protein